LKLRTGNKYHFSRKGEWTKKRAAEKQGLETQRLSHTGRRGTLPTSSAHTLIFPSAKIFAQNGNFQVEKFRSEQRVRLGEFKKQPLRIVALATGVFGVSLKPRQFQKRNALNIAAPREKPVAA
jgi:hypothetical protein